MCEKLAKVEEHVEKLCTLECALLSFAKEAHEKRGFDCINTHEYGDVVDMVKDLAEAREETWEALYFELKARELVEAEHEEEHEAHTENLYHRRHEHHETGEQKLDDILASLRHMWQEVPVEERRKMKVDLQALVNEIAL